MRALWLVLAGCGRIGFDALGDDSPIPTCTGHDEDGDGFPDGCDVCPGIADVAQRDGDDDGVGDACDPRPTIAGDYFQVVDMHTMPSTTYSQLQNDATWTGDELRLGSDPSAGAAFFTLPELPSRIEVRCRIVSSLTTERMWFGYWYNQSPDFTQKVFATGDQDIGEPNGSLFLKEDDAGASRFSAPIAGPSRFDGDVFTIILHTPLTTGGDDVLYAIDSDGTRSTQLAVQIPRYREGFLEAQRATVDFQYFIAYAIR